MNRHRSCLLLALAVAATLASAQEPPLSEATGECLVCHEMLHPGIVADWRSSLHATVTPGRALAVQGLRRVSSETVPEKLRDVVVGCAECHTQRPDAHADTFDHGGHAVHVVVSPADCATCHAVEVDQYSRNLMAHAYGNLERNPVYQDLQRNILGPLVREAGTLEHGQPDADTKAVACLYCHGTALQVTGKETRETELGEMEFPVIAGWPNQGVGRVNLDGTLGSCSACHTRHRFSIAEARQPYTCKECHVGPDVPAFKVYSASKHGTIYHSEGKDWNFAAVPWTVEDFRAPTCAVCHISQVVDASGEVVAERTHEMMDRLGWRIFGLVYAHPQPKSPDTTIIRNKDGLPLPTDFGGGFAGEFLIDERERAARRERMSRICRSCHADSWVRGHFARHDRAIATTNAAVAAGTGVMAEIWSRGFAAGLDRESSPFDEAIERTWTDTWLFHANSIRFATAMAGGGDYAVFADGFYTLSKQIRELHDWLGLRELVEPAAAEPAGSAAAVPPAQDP